MNKSKSGCWGEFYSNLTDVLSKKRNLETGRDTKDVYTQGRECENTAKRQPSASQGEGPQGQTCRHLDLGFPDFRAVRK